jgi:hypothetical protein
MDNLCNQLEHAKDSKRFRANGEWSMDHQTYGLGLCSDALGYFGRGDIAVYCCTSWHKGNDNEKSRRGRRLVQIIHGAYNIL